MILLLIWIAIMTAVIIVNWLGSGEPLPSEDGDKTNHENHT